LKLAGEGAREAHMALVVYDVTSRLRKAEATVEVKDFTGQSEYLPVDREFLTDEGGKHYLPVTVLAEDGRKKQS
jgi:hypothetical protein